MISLACMLPKFEVCLGVSLAKGERKKRVEVTYDDVNDKGDPILVEKHTRLLCNKRIKNII